MLQQRVQWSDPGVGGRLGCSNHPVSYRSAGSSFQLPPPLCGRAVGSRHAGMGGRPQTALLAGWAADGRQRSNTSRASSKLSSSSIGGSPTMGGHCPVGERLLVGSWLSLGGCYSQCSWSSLGGRSLLGVSRGPWQRFTTWNIADFPLPSVEVDYLVTVVSILLCGAKYSMCND